MRQRKDKRANQQKSKLAKEQKSKLAKEQISKRAKEQGGRQRVNDSTKKSFTTDKHRYTQIDMDFL